MAISDQVIEQVRLSVDIAEVVREYVPSMKKAGRNWKALCPFHHEKTPSFMVSPEKGIFHCFGCHAGGDVFKFIMLVDGITWPEAVRKLGARCGISIQETKEDVVKRSQKQKIYDVLESAAEFYHRSLNELKDAAPVREYLKKRGVTAESIEKFRIGFAPRNALLPAALKKGLANEDLIASGVMTKTEKGKLFEYMSGRLVFPIIDTHGRVVAFGGRTMGDDQPKYLNTPETAVYSKSSQLYGLFQALPVLRQQKHAIILEGYMDVVVTHQYGAANTVASLGTAFTLQHSHVLNRYVDQLTLLFDADPAGEGAARRAVEIFLDTDLAVKVVTLPEGLDPDEFIIREGNEKFFEFVAGNGKSSCDFLLDYTVSAFGKETPEQKAKVVNEIVPLIAKIHNSIVRNEWVRMLASVLNIREDDVRQEVSRFEKKTSRLPAAKTSAPTGTLYMPIRSAEEEVIQMLSAFPHFMQIVKDVDFKNERIKKVFDLLVKGISVSQIVEHLEPEEAEWFTELLMEEREYASPDTTIANVLKDIKETALEKERQELEKEVVMMLDGKKPFDDAKYEHYKELTSQLKGSEKISC